MATATQWKEKGNVAFKAGQMAKAAELYAKAEKLENKDPVYPSNLSASFYELGDYAGCCDAIFRSWRLMPEEKNDSLAVRLSTRLAKALSHAARQGSISPERLQRDSNLIGEIRAFPTRAMTDGSKLSPEHLQAWKYWDIGRDEMDRVARESNDARTRLSRLPVFKKRPDPTLEYYIVGTDEIMSLVDDWGAGEPSPLKLKEMPVKDLGHMNFLFGGCGDARQVFGSLIGLLRAYKDLNKSRQAALKVHMTLLDIYPASLARDLCMFLLLNDLIENEYDEETIAEIKATIAFVYLAIIIPSYCWDRYQKVVAELRSRLTETPLRLPPWLYVVEDCIPPILEILDFWTKFPEEKSTKAMLSHHHVIDEKEMLLNNPLITGAFKDKYHENYLERRQEFSELVDAMTEEQLMEIGLAELGKTPEQNKKILAERRDAYLDEAVELMEKGPTTQFAYEKEWFKMVQCFMPPRQLRKRHPGFSQLFKGVMEHKKPTKGLLQKVKSHINSDWKPNLTFFDGANEEHRMLGSGGYPNLKQLDVFQSVRSLYNFNGDFNIREGFDKTDSAAFNSASQFFDGVIDALRTMGDKLTLEVILGELTQELSKMKLNGDHTRPADFPRSFTRTWLSNVPDYTHGPLNTAVFILPNLRSDAAIEPEVACNCLLNTGIWNSNDEYCHTYTLLHSVDIRRYLGCRVVKMEPIYGSIRLAHLPHPRPLKELASRNEVRAWLTRILLNTLVPPQQTLHTPFRVRFPNNLVAFVNLLVHLHSVGFPAHWLSDFIETILNDSLITDIAPYRKGFPIPVSDMDRRVPRHRARLDPWLAELENIFAIAYEAIPFPLLLPAGFASDAATIGMFEAAAEKGFLYNLPIMQNFDPVGCLLFYKSSAGLRPHEIAMELGEILNGQMQPPVGHIHIVTAIEVLDMPKGTVRWRMNKERVRTMQNEGWDMICYRSDFGDFVSAPIPANEWKTVDIATE
ncbi:hypothetical protein EWM64_g4494 [Hericium alpestre]|uniref:DUF4470 domain-containing protein n=1 Tax=Hericium alpestre TaxID=135208 RepID=A0A4Y9ZY98_9AGAM|nr:hypothetical protein EWM64_g4494 [Hericium alpestre]